MRIAKDGKQFDIVNPSVDCDSKLHEVEIIQLMRADFNYFEGERRRLIAELDEKTARKADDLIIMVRYNFDDTAEFIIQKRDGEKNRYIFQNDRCNQDVGDAILTHLIEENSV